MFPASRAIRRPCPNGLIAAHPPKASTYATNNAAQAAKAATADAGYLTDHRPPRPTRRAPRRQQPRRPEREQRSYQPPLHYQPQDRTAHSGTGCANCIAVYKIGRPAGGAATARASGELGGSAFELVAVHDDRSAGLPACAAVTTPSRNGF